MAKRKGAIARRGTAPRRGRAEKADRRAPARKAAPRSAPARPSSKRLLRAGDLMSRNPITVQEDMTVADLCDLFQEKNINGAPVVDGRGRLVGVVAQDDIIYGAMGHPDPDPAPAPATRALEGPLDPGGPESSPARRASQRVVAMLRQRHLEGLPDSAPRPGERPFWADTRPTHDPLRMPVSAIMTSPAISAEEGTPLRDICNVMWNLRIHRIPIVRGGKVTGLVSSLDLCRAILDGLIEA
jgi:CBS domain-containing protein